MKRFIPLTLLPWVFILWVFLFLTGVPAHSMATAKTPTLKPENIEEGMTGYGKTVFEGSDIDTFSVRVEGVLENVMPDLDLVLIRAKRPILEKTNIMSGMSGSPIYINGKLIGALAYSWPFAKEPIAGVTPIENILNSSSPRSSLSPNGTSLKKISTPIVANGFIGDVKKKISEKLSDFGLRNTMIAGGSSGTSSSGESSDSKLQPGSALGVQLMKGDLGMASIGTITHRKGDQIYAFGHQFMNAGKIQFPLTTATVHTAMPSLRNSFKLASVKKTVGTITEDRRAAVVGQVGEETEMLPVSIHLNVPSRNYSRNYSVQVIRNKYLSPGLINSAAANFAKSKMNELGINRLRTQVKVNLKDHQDLKFEKFNLVKGSFDPWAFLPLSSIWANPFSTPSVEDVEITLKLIPDRESARITEMWLDRQQVEPGERVTVFTEINPYRSENKIRRFSIRIPTNIDAGYLRLSVIPASRLAQLQPKPRTLNQLIERYNSWISGKKLALLLETTKPSLKAAGHRMPRVPRTVAGVFGVSSQSEVSRSPSSRYQIFETEWLVSGSKSMTLKVK